MEYNGKNYELIHDKTGNLDCPDCAFGNIDCSVTEAVNKCNKYQVWKECAQEKETEQQSNCNLPHVSVAKHPLPRPLEAWKQAREMELSDYIEWHLEQERRGNAR